MIIILEESINHLDLPQLLKWLRISGYTVSGVKGTCNNCLHNFKEDSPKKCFKTITVIKEGHTLLTDKIILDYCSNWKPEDFKGK